MLLPTRLGHLTQGYIFSGARAEDYADCEVHGLVITARCDVEQDKAEVFNYFPVVRLSDWKNRDGKRIFCSRVKKQIRSGSRDILLHAGFSPSILEYQSIAQILDRLFPRKSLDKRIKNARSRAIAFLQQEQLLSKTLGSDDETDLNQLSDEFHKLRNGLLKELVEQRLNGYYFLPRVDVADTDRGYVVILREIQHVPRDIARKIANGLSRDEYEEFMQTRIVDDQALNWSKTAYSMPISCLASPFLEHLMQTFSNLFCRIGLPDPDVSKVDVLWASGNPPGGENT